MEAKMTLIKVAVIREDDPRYPVGTPGPMYLNCRCGGKPKTHFKEDEAITCSCGKKYTGSGYLL